jgi:hypothetical protein
MFKNIIDINTLKQNNCAVNTYLNTRIIRCNKLIHHDLVHLMDINLV